MYSLILRGVPNRLVADRTWRGKRFDIDSAKVQQTFVQTVAHLHGVRVAAVALLDRTSLGSQYLGHTGH